MTELLAFIADLLESKAKYEKELSIARIPQPEGDYNENANNYISANPIDCKYKRVAYVKKSVFGSTLIIIGNNITCRHIRGVTPPFQLHDDSVIYIRKGELIVRNIAKPRKKTVLDTNVGGVFMTYGERIIYTSDGKLKLCDITTKESRVIYEREVYRFCICDGRLLVVDSSGVLTEIPFDDLLPRMLTCLKVEGFPFEIMTCGSRIMLKDSAKGVKLIDLESFEAETVEIVADALANDRSAVICSDELLFFSYHKTKTNGSSVKMISDPSNGVYVVELETMKIKKIVPDTFDELYLFGKSLFGVSKNKLYHIETQCDGAKNKTYIL